MEFNVILQELKDQLLPRAAEAGLAEGEKFIIVLDNGPVHTNAEAICGQDTIVCPHPSRSPDCNKIVEHTHSFVDATMKAWLVQWRRQYGPVNPTVQQCKERCEQIFKSITAASIHKDVLSLPATWRAVVAAEGGWLKDALR
jgi:hypothetical protein